MKNYWKKFWLVLALLVLVMGPLASLAQARAKARGNTGPSRWK